MTTKSLARWASRTSLFFLVTSLVAHELLELQDGHLLPDQSARALQRSLAAPSSRTLGKRSPSAPASTAPQRCPLLSTLEPSRRAVIAAVTVFAVMRCASCVPSSDGAPVGEGEGAAEGEGAGGGAGEGEGECPLDSCPFGETCTSREGPCQPDPRGPFCAACTGGVGSNECGGRGNFCLAGGDGTESCGVDCSAGQSCPTGFTCADVVIIPPSTPECSAQEICSAGSCIESGSLCVVDADCPLGPPAGDCSEFLER